MVDSCCSHAQSAITEKLGCWGYVTNKGVPRGALPYLEKTKELAELRTVERRIIFLRGTYRYQTRAQSHVSWLCLSTITKLWTRESWVRPESGASIQATKLTGSRDSSYARKLSYYGTWVEESGVVSSYGCIILRSLILTFFSILHKWVILSNTQNGMNPTAHKHHSRKNPCGVNAT